MSTPRAHFLHGSIFSDTIRYFTRNRFLLYREERDDFDNAIVPQSRPASSASSTPSSTLEQLPGRRTTSSTEEELKISLDVPLPLTSLDEGSASSLILVDWYGPQDPENPLNWNTSRKIWVSFCIGLYTFAVYVGGALMASGFDSLEADFGLSRQVVTFSMSVYGAGALLLSPLSEVPQLGRNLPYWLPAILASALQLGAVFSPTFGGLVVFRFLVGLLGAPVVASGGANLADVWGTARLPVALGCWAVPSFFAPALAPLLTTTAVEKHGWRWCLLVQFILLAVSALCLSLLPETSADNILYRRAHRLRRLTGSAVYRSQGELDSQHLSAADIARQALAIPFKISLLDPSILFCHCYLSFCYGIFFTYFEAYPIVYTVIHPFSSLGQAATYVCVCVGCVLAYSLYIPYQLLYISPHTRDRLLIPEHYLHPALFSCVGTAAGLWIFAWTSQPSLHWILPLIGTGLFAFSNFWTFQLVYYYLIIAYDKYAASVLAANDFLRSSLAAGLVHAAIPLFHSRLGLHGGVSLLAGLTTLGCGGIWTLYLFGARLRARSRFAVGPGQRGEAM
ncbi:hypothetical protein JCM10207_005818 [Rhodosporidiobolus poonsookiae]